MLDIPIAPWLKDLAALVTLGGFFYGERMGVLNKLTEMLSGPPSLGSGAAQKAADVLKNRAYQLHVQEAQASGEKPMTPEQWLAARG